MLLVSKSFITDSKQNAQGQHRQVAASALITNDALLGSAIRLVKTILSGKVCSGSRLISYRDSSIGNVSRKSVCVDYCIHTLFPICQYNTEDQRCFSEGSSRASVRVSDKVTLTCGQTACSLTFQHQQNLSEKTFLSREATGQTF